MGLFKKKPPSVLRFVGSSNDLAYTVQDIGDKKIIDAIAEGPYELLHFQNGLLQKVYKNEKVSIKDYRSATNRLVFVNTKMPCSANFGTKELIEYMDSQTGRVVEIGASGTISLYIADAVKFVDKVLGLRRGMSATDVAGISQASVVAIDKTGICVAEVSLIGEMLPKIMSEFKDHFLTVINDNQIQYAEFDSSLKVISDMMIPKLNASLAKYGIGIEEFIIECLVKPVELKDSMNKKIKTQEEREQELGRLDYEKERLSRQQDINRSARQSEVDINKIVAQGNADIQKMDYDAKGVSYKELREMDREDIRTVGDVEAKVREATKIAEVNIINKSSEQVGKCKHCDSEITSNHIFCPTCRRKV